MNGTFAEKTGLQRYKALAFFLSVAITPSPRPSPPEPSAEEASEEDEEEEDEDATGSSSRLSVGPKLRFKRPPLEPLKQMSQVTSTSCSGGSRSPQTSNTL